MYTVKKLTMFHLPNSPWPEIIYLLPAMEGLISDIPAANGKIANLFLQCSTNYKVLQHTTLNSAQEWDAPYL
jgi:hypothetical protein